MGTNINNWEKNHLGAAMGQWIHSFVTTRGDCVSSLFGMVDGMLPRPGRRSLLLFTPGTSSIDCHPIRTFNTINGPSSYSIKIRIQQVHPILRHTPNSPNHRCSSPESLCWSCALCCCLFGGVLQEVTFWRLILYYEIAFEYTNTGAPTPAEPVGFRSDEMKYKQMCWSLASTMLLLTVCNFCNI